MSDIRFDINYMSILINDSCQAENQVSQSVRGFEKIAQGVTRELSSFNAEGAKRLREVQARVYEIRDLKSDIDRKITKAQGQRKKEIQPPQRPSMPSNATPEQRNAIMSQYESVVSRVSSENAQIREYNRRIDKYVERCHSAKNRLEEVIAKLHQLEESLKGEINHTVSFVNGFLGKASSIANTGSTICSKTSEFRVALQYTYESAQRLYLMEPTSVKNLAFMDKQFVIKNTHEHMVVSSNTGFSSFSSVDTVRAEPEKKEITVATTGELLVKDRDEASFLEKIKGVKMVKMPSGNLHKLGGKRFISKMNSLGYTLVTQADGSAIDINGMLHWEKNDD